MTIIVLDEGKREIDTCGNSSGTAIIDGINPFHINFRAEQLADFHPGSNRPNCAGMNWLLLQGAHRADLAQTATWIPRQQIARIVVGSHIAADGAHSTQSLSTEVPHE